MTITTSRNVSSFQSFLSSCLITIAIVTLGVQITLNPSYFTADAFTISSSKTTSFQLQRYDQRQRHATGARSTTTFLPASVEDEISEVTSPAVSESDKILQDIIDDLYPSGELITLVIKDHRPLGCTIEESLAASTSTTSTSNKNTVKINDDDDDDTMLGLEDSPAVFVSKIVEGGHAEQAGIKVGDVIIGVTGLFGAVMPVAGFEIDRV